MLVIPAFKACMQSALIRANIKPPVELVVANLVTIVLSINQPEKKQLYHLQWYNLPLWQNP